MRHGGQQGIRMLVEVVQGEILGRIVVAVAATVRCAGRGAHEGIGAEEHELRFDEIVEAKMPVPQYDRCGDRSGGRCHRSGGDGARGGARALSR
jgi:hypothetical protein